MKEYVVEFGKDQTTASKEIKLYGKSYTNSFTKTDESCPKWLKKLRSFVTVAPSATIAIIRMLEECIRQRQLKMNTKPYWLNREKAYRSPKKSFIGQKQ